MTKAIAELIAKIVILVAAAFIVLYFVELAM